MIKKSRGRKRDVSIYLILTIVVLISISGGCKAVGYDRVPREESKYSREAGLLITYFIDNRYTSEYKQYKSLGDTIPYTELNANDIDRADALIFETDGLIVSGEHKIKNNITKFGSTWVELSLGHHDIKIMHYLKVGYSFFVTPDGRPKYPPSEKTYYYGWVINIGVDIQANHVYQVCTSECSSTILEKKFDGCTRNFDLGTTEIKLLEHKYDSKTGFATHPTDSGLSFKVK